MQNKYDVIVVGAGPAGSTAARVAAQKGCSVLMLEKDREVGMPVRCGEAVGEKGIKKVLNLQDRWIANKIDAVRLIAPNGDVVNVAHNEIGYVLHRKIFDYDLAMMAADAGVHVVTKAYVYGLVIEDGVVKGVKVKHLGKEYTLHAKIVIGADGVESRVGRWAGLKTHVRMKDIESCAQVTVGNISVDRRYCDFYFSDDIAPGGYLWVFPKGPNAANIGLGIAGHKVNSKAAIDYLNEFIDKKFPNAAKLITVAGGVPCAPYMDNIFASGLMLVGDAAHQANPISGGGIIQAILAAEIAGEEAAAAIKESDVSEKRLAQYEKRWFEKGGQNHIRAYRLKEVAYKLTDEDLNKTAEKINKVRPEKRTIISIFKVALFNHPKYIPDILKVFMPAKGSSS
ncbi:NAD(P)/FAD-dependent oxidoreductase [candidate division KSB1 bacterium]|nr:NAD(P)/FAD-dependent oxidoreductase [candidate division KSB1 bacterium]